MAALACLVLVLLFARPAAADDPLQITRASVRPGGMLSVVLGSSVDTSKPLFLRLDGRGAGAGPVVDVPLEAAAARRRLVRLPFPQLREGTYATELINDQGAALGAGGPLRVLSSEPPVITKIIPRVSYPEAKQYDFEIVGERFSNHPDDTIVRINDTAVAFAARVRDDHDAGMTASECGSARPCLIVSRRALRVIGLTEERLHRPLSVSVQIDTLMSNTKPLLLSKVQRGAPATIAFLTLAVVAGLVYLLARDKARRYKPVDRSYSTLAYLFIEPQSNTYSLSRFQLLAWTAATVIAYTYLAASQFLVQWTWVLPSVPEGLPALLGISAGTTAFAVGSETRSNKGAGPVHPASGDFITTGGVFAPERLQFFLWTLLGAGGFVVATLAQDPATVTDLPKIPDNFVPLMGVSSLGYLAGKALRKAGPVIRQLVPPPPYPPAAPGGAAPPPPIRIVGESLSPRAQVRVNGVLVPPAQVTPGASQSADTEFVTELVAAPTALQSPGPGVAPVKVINPDGQSAEL